MILTELPRRMEEQETHMEKWMKGRYMANQKRLSVGTGVPAPRGRGIVMLILLIPRAKKSKNPGSIYPLYMASYGAFRFLDEFFRTSSTGMLFHLSHVWAAIAFAAGLSIYIEINARNHQRKKVIKK